jgi:transaldolase
MTSKLEQLRTMTTVVSDTGDMEAIRIYKPTDATTNPSLILKASEMSGYARFVDEAIVWGGKQKASVGEVTDRIAVNFGAELTKIVPGRVSTEVDADLSFDTEAMIAKAKSFIALYKERGIDQKHILIKLASTWEGLQAAKSLQAEGIDCNMTLAFSIAQAIAAGESKAFLLSPFVGRILDWHVKAGGGPYTSETDPGVQSVRAIYAYYKTHGVKTIVMGASFRNTGEIEALAGCDRLTISPQLLETLSKEEGELKRQLDPAKPGSAPSKIAMDEKTFRWMMNEDQMATEKLSDGIRQFAADLNKLKTTVQQRMAKAA